MTMPLHWLSVDQFRSAVEAVKDEDPGDTVSVAMAALESVGLYVSKDVLEAFLVDGQ